MALNTNAGQRILAWPRYESARDLLALATEFGPLLRDRPDVCLCLRHDPARDLPVDKAAEVLEQAFAQTLGPDAQIEILLVDDDLDDAGWAALGRAVTGVIALPSTAERERHRRLTGLGHRLLRLGPQLGELLQGGQPGSPSQPATATTAGTKIPRVTAIVSTYKSAVFMKGCLEDLVGQTLYARGELEILVIDSGSPEDEGRIVAEMQKQHPDIRYLRTEREGLYTAWNRGIKLARAPYLTNANTDDRHRPDALEVMAQALDQDPTVAVVYGDSLITNRPNESFARHTAQRRLEWPDFDYARLQTQCVIGPQPMWRKSLHDRWGAFDDSFVVAGDYEFWLRIGRSEKFKHLPQLLGLYLQNEAGLEYASGKTMAETRQVQRRYATPATAAADPGPGRPPLDTVLSLPGAPPAEPPTVGASRSPLVSVIMPTYNRPEFLARALGSLARQSLRDFEVVVVNDAGQPLEAVLARFASHLTITYLRHGVNRDRAEARNSALRVARGKYIAYLDDDDCYRPDHLQTLVGALQSGSHKVAYTDAVWVHEEKGFGPGPEGYRPSKIAFRQSVPFDRERLLVVNYIPVLSVMHERALIDELGAFDADLGTHEDWEFFLRLSEECDFLHIPRVTADISYRPDGSSTTGGNYGDFHRTMVLIHERYDHRVKNRPDLRLRQAEARARLQANIADAESINERADRAVRDARALLAQGELTRASETANAAIHLAPHSADLILVIADVFAAQKQLAAACDALEQGEALHPVSAAVPLRLAQLLIEAGDLARAQWPARRAAALGAPAALGLLQRHGWASAELQAGQQP